MADLKITLFFLDHCSGKIYRQNEDRDIVKLLTIFHDKTPQRSAPWIYFFMGGNKTNIGEEPRIKGDCTVFFSFRIYKKKTFHTKTNFGSKNSKNHCFNKIWLMQTHFEPKWVFVWNVFFCMFKTKRKMGKLL